MHVRMQHQDVCRLTNCLRCGETSFYCMCCVHFTLAMNKSLSLSLSPPTLHSPRLSPSLRLTHTQTHTHTHTHTHTQRKANSWISSHILLSAIVIIMYKLRAYIYTVSESCRVSQPKLTSVQCHSCIAVQSCS